MLRDVEADTLGKTLADTLAETLALVKCEKLNDTLNKVKAFALFDALADWQQKSTPETLDEHWPKGRPRH